MILNDVHQGIQKRKAASASAAVPVRATAKRQPAATRDFTAAPGRPIDWAIPAARRRWRGGSPSGASTTGSSPPRC